MILRTRDSRAGVRGLGQDAKGNVTSGSALTSWEVPVVVPYIMTQSQQIEDVGSQVDFALAISDEQRATQQHIAQASTRLPAMFSVAITGYYPNLTASDIRETIKAQYYGSLGGRAAFESSTIQNLLNRLIHDWELAKTANPNAAFTSAGTSTPAGGGPQQTTLQLNPVTLTYEVAWTAAPGGGAQSVNAPTQVSYVIPPPQGTVFNTPSGQVVIGAPTPQAVVNVNTGAVIATPPSGAVIRPEVAVGVHVLPVDQTQPGTQAPTSWWTWGPYPSGTEITPEMNTESVVSRTGGSPAVTSSGSPYTVNQPSGTPSNTQVKTTPNQTTLPSDQPMEDLIPGIPNLWLLGGLALVLVMVSGKR